MKTLQNLTNLLFKNSPEFTETLQEDIINPLLAQGYIFTGYSATGTSHKIPKPAGLHTLIFESPDDKSEDNTEIPEYEDEGTSSFHYYFYGTLYILIPMPY